MSVEFQDGGAFAECPFVQYPKGLGRHAVTPTVLSHISAVHNIPAAAAATASTAPSSSSAGRGPSGYSSSALVLAAPSPSQQQPRQASEEETAKELEKTTARTRAAIDASLNAAQSAPALAEASFSGKGLQRGGGGALVLSTAALGADGPADPAPIVRSPTKAPKRSVLEVEAARRDAAAAGAVVSATATGSTGTSAGPSITADTVVVPFSVSSWHNKKKLVIPVEQRLAQLNDERTSGSDGGVSSGVMDLAVAMRQAQRDVGKELQQRAEARSAEEEQKQQQREAEEMARARQLMDENAARIAQQQQLENRRGESREQRLARLRMERELREREKAEKQRQRQLQKAAARLQMRVEDLEADEALLRALDEGEVGGGSSGATAPPPTAVSASFTATKGEGGATLLKTEGGGGADDDDEDGGRARGKKSSFQMFMRPAVSNEGISREMAALAALESAGGAQDGHGSSGRPAPAANDGIRMPDVEGGVGSGDDDSDEDEDASGGRGALALNALVKKRQRLL